MSGLLLKNRYQITQTLAEGGFGKTYLAQDIDMPSGRLCVIKQLKLLTHAPEIYQIAKERFRREAAILEKLGESHGQIPRLYGYFEQDEKFYLVQEWIQGPTLTQKILKDGPFNNFQAAQLLTNILSILKYVHSQKIVHRDIKPDNILLRLNDQRPVLIDFGAVKETMGTIITPSGKNASTVIVGTPGFMSSEQSIGRPTYGSDLYSLGLTAIFALTGKIPQELENDYETDSLLWLPEWPIHPVLVEVINKSIESHPRDRFTSAQSMLEALEPVLVELSNEKIISKTILEEPQLPPLSKNISANKTQLQPDSNINLAEYSELEQALSKLFNPSVASNLLENVAHKANNFQQLINNLEVYLSPSQFKSLKNQLQPPSPMPKMGIVSQPPIPPSIPPKPIIDDVFIGNCEKILAEIIGPIAKLLINNTLKKNPHLTKGELIENLSNQLNDPQKAALFKGKFN